MTDSTSVLVGSAIHAARVRSGLSMRALAVRCGVSQPFLSQVEKGTTSPSLATLYKIAEALDIAPASLLPERPGPEQVLLVRATEGRRIPVHDSVGAAIGRLIAAGPDRMLEVYDYDIGPSDDLDAWFASPSEMLVYVIAGRLEVELSGLGTWQLGPSDALFHPGEIRHRWKLLGRARARVLLVVARSADDAAAHDPQA